MDKIDILGVNVDIVDMKCALSAVLGFLESDEPHSVYTPNSEIIMQAYKNDGFRRVLNGASLVVADGIGVVYASRILKKPIPERVAGFDLACGLIEKLSGGQKSFYFFGGKPGVADLARENLLKKYPALNIVGISDGYFDDTKEKAIIDDIKAKKPDVLFVCLGAPKQEKWIDEHKNELGAKVLMGIGGSLDVFAGIAERAPEKYRKLGLEWLYRLKKQPSRFMRMLALPKFGLTVLFKGRRCQNNER